MRVGIVRTDLGDGIYFADLRTKAQGLQASLSPSPFQAMTVRRPTDAELEAILNDFALLSLRATDVAVNVDTSVNDTLR
jgi:hypothetical protein